MSNYGISLQRLITGKANLIKTGAGTLCLQASNNTFTGNTIIKGGIISCGTLIVKNTTGSATGTYNVTLANTGVLGGTGLISGSFTMNSGSNLSPGNGSAGTLTISSNLVLQTGSKTTFKISVSAGNKLKVGATLILKGMLEMVNQGVAYQSGSSFILFTAAIASGIFDALLPLFRLLDLKGIHHV